jgi:aminoglycoside phosphotransferase (APT) family kinase protein
MTDASEWSRAMAEKRSDRADVDGAFVSRLIEKQFPRWASLPVTEVTSAGTDNTIFRLGPDLAVRLPRHRSAADSLLKECQWLPRLSPLLPLAVPIWVGQGVPGDGFPYPWSVQEWLDGQDLASTPDVDLHDAATRLGWFVRVLRWADAPGGPPSFRGAPIRTSDAVVRARIHKLGAQGLMDVRAAIACWETVLAAPDWAGEPVWIHADLYPTNLLATHGRLTAVIDFGGLGVGDPACDMLPAWALLDAQTRASFRGEADVDDATWERGRGWAFALGLGAVDVYQESNHVLAALGRRAITEVLRER